ncbi:hypothetical protein J31TS4_38730 [Paenibacillus sp. J31TS4]|nr:hypothetical protein J31TS4_38730 [Paenibacillus sp. J31TS4]
MFENLDTGGVKRKYETVEKAALAYSVEELCRFLGVSRSGYNKYKKRKASNIRYCVLDQGL